MALAVDFLSPIGGTPTDNEDKARDMIGTLDAGKVVTDAEAAIAWLKARPDSNGKVGIVGFCWGGGVVGRVAAADPSLDAGVVFYGQAPATETVAGIKAPLLLNYAGLDERINAGVPAFEAALKEGGKTYTLYMYDGCQARLPQRHLRGALQRGGGQARLAAHRRLLQGQPRHGLIAERSRREPALGSFLLRMASHSTAVTGSMSMRRRTREDMPE